MNPVLISDTQAGAVLDDIEAILLTQFIFELVRLGELKSGLQVDDWCLGSDPRQMVDHDHAFRSEIRSHDQMLRKPLNSPFEDILDPARLETPSQLFDFKL